MAVDGNSVGVRRISSTASMDLHTVGVRRISTTASVDADRRWREENFIYIRRTGQAAAVTVVSSEQQIIFFNLIVTYRRKVPVAEFIFNASSR